MNTLRIAVPNPDELLNAGAYGAGAIVRIQSGSSSTGPWSNLTTVALVTKTYEYVAYDTAGTASTWYQTRYENAGGTILSAYSAAFQAVPSVYAALGDVKERLGLDDTNTTYDGFLNKALKQATTFIESRCQRTFFTDPGDGTTKTYTFDGWSESVGYFGKVLLVPRGIVSLTTVQVQTYTGGPTTTIPTTDWFLRPTAQEVSPGWPFTELWVTNIPSSTDTTPSFYPGFNTISLTGVFGWPAIPADIEDVCLSLVVSAYRARGAGGGNSFTIAEDGTRTFERMLSDRDRRTLGLYRLKMPLLIGGD